MSSISLEVNDTETGLQWYIELKRRITILRGDSGLGKSEFVRIIVSPPIGIEVRTSRNCVAADGSNWDAVLSGTRESIIILDDIETVSSAKFAKRVKETSENHNYFLIIGREQIGEQSLSEDTFYKLSYSVDSILKFAVSEDGKKHFTEPYFDFGNISLPKAAIHHVLVEDSSNGVIFFRHLFGDCVIAAKNGKSSVTANTEETLKKEDDGILVLFDAAAFGCHIDKFYYKVMLKYPNIYVDSNYECFEYFLLNTSFFRDNKKVQAILSDPSDEANQYISWERFYEDVLEEATAGTEIKYVHGNAKFRECWFESCNDFEHNKCGSHLRQKCPFYMADDDKCRALLEGSLFREYLNLREWIQQ